MIVWRQTDEFIFHLNQQCDPEKNYLTFIYKKRTITSQCCCEDYMS